jgi:hypothetical protein
MRVSIQNGILMLHFEGKRDDMNRMLDPMSDRYEGPVHHREGHNFPSSYISDNHVLAPYKAKCSYVIGFFNTKSIRHELLHAKYFMDADYRSSIEREWNELREPVQHWIRTFLQRLGYSERVLLDEYQAYRYSEAENFFGIRLPQGCRRSK